MLSFPSSYQENTCDVPKKKHDSKELLCNTEGQISVLEFRYAEEKIYKIHFSISWQLQML